MRICGRTLRPSTLAERRVLLALGFPTMRVPRGMNPFIVARRVGRLAKGHTDDHVFLRELVHAQHKATPPSPQPEPDTTEPVGPELMPVHASAA
jgi:hypothetical protein